MIIEETTQVEEKDEGFTLVELLIVIVILGILATIVVFAVRGITDQGQQSACAADSKALQVAVESYFAQNPESYIGDATDAEALADNPNEPLPEVMLVEVELIRETSANYDVTSGGDVDGVGKCAP